MAYPSNPFTPYSPVSPAYFSGREREVQGILDHLASAARGSSAISGERRIGRTSLLHYLTERLSQAPLQEQFLPLYVDCQSIPRFTPTRFWQRVLKLLENKVTDDSISQAMTRLLEQEEISCADFEVVSDRIYENGQTLVLLLDEFEWVVRTDPASIETTHDFLSGLRALINRVPKGLALLIGAVHPLDRLCEEIEFRGSPFSNSFLLVRLRPFTEAEIDQFFVRMLKDTSLEFTEDERSYIKQVAGGHPLLLQTASSLLFESRVQVGPIENYWAISKRFNEQASHHFKSLWEASTEGEKTLLLAIATRDLDHELTRARLARELRSLTERGLVVHREGNPEIFSFLFAQWIIENGERPISMADPETLETKLTALKEGHAIYERNLQHLKFKEAQHGPNPPLDLVNEIDSLVNRIVELDAQILNLEKTLRD
ncbi:MAG TPA: ATP-binding protein [Anaerolineae bacterium]|nr:ATP-binding protein [Anaerolineae bacterium]